MKGYRFFAELPDNRASKAASKRYDQFDRHHLRNLAARGLHANLVALLLNDEGQPRYGYSDSMMDAYCIEFGNIILTRVQRGWLDKRCVRIDEDLARKLCPAMFEFLEK